MGTNQRMFIQLHHYHSSIDITKRPPYTRHCISNRNVFHAHIPQPHLILQRPIRTRRHIQKRHRPRNRPLPVFQVQILPCPPHPIDHGVMEPKRWIAWAVEEIGTSVAADGIMTAEMDAQEGAGGLHAVLESGDGGIIEEEVGDFIVGGLGGGVWINVAAEAAGVIAEP
jgi:hypothetical protein